MDIKTGWFKRHGGKLVNVLLISFILLLVFVPDVKSWIMRQFINTGLYNASVEKNPGLSAPGIRELDLIFVDSAGNGLTAASLKGKIVFINFWATWCPPCRAEMPSLNKLFQEFKNDNDFVFLFVSEDEEQDKALEYLRSKNYSLPLYHSRGGGASSLYSGTLPTTLVFDKSGKLIHKHEGMANYNTGKFISTLKSLK